MKSKLISGNLFTDERGSLGFVNDFNMKEVVRMYRITHHDASVLRAWQGHRMEQKWFHAAAGEWIIHTVQPDSWVTPSGQETVLQFQLNASEPCILHVPGGNMTAIRARSAESVLIIFSDMSLSESKADDYRFSADTWKESSIEIA